MINVELLKTKMEQNNVSVTDVADAIETDRSTFYRKLSRVDSSFSVEQAKRISDLLHLTSAEFTAIFFA